jgi:hypothetical protein
MVVGMAGLGLGLVGVFVFVGVWVFVNVFVSMGGFGEVVAFVDVDFGGGDSAAIDFFDLERSVEVQRGGGFVQNFGIDSCVK